MDRPDNSPTDDARVPEVTAHRLLARAVQLDATRDTMMTVAELRAVALEAGIAPEALDQALQELRTGTSTEITVADETKRSLARSIAVNVGAMAGTWLGLIAIVTVGSRFVAGWGLPAAATVIGLAGGVAFAHRLRARFARLAMLGMAASHYYGTSKDALKKMSGRCYLFGRRIIGAVAVGI